MNKQIASFANGAVTVIENEGVISLNFNESLSVGGGEAAGIVKVQGQGSIQLDGALGLKLGEALLNSHLPDSVKSLAMVIEGIANQAVSALE